MNLPSKQSSVPLNKIFIAFLVIVSFLCVSSFAEAKGDTKAEDDKSQVVEDQINEVQAQLIKQRKQNSKAEKKERRQAKRDLKIKEKKRKSDRKKAQKLYKEILSACKSGRVDFAKMRRKNLNDLVEAADFSQGFKRSMNNKILKCDKAIRVAQRKQEGRVRKVKAINEKIAYDIKSKEDEAKQKEIKEERKKRQARQLKQKRLDSEKNEKERRREDAALERKERLGKIEKKSRRTRLATTEKIIKNKKQSLEREVREQKRENFRQSKYAERELSESIYSYYKEGIDYYRAGSYKEAKQTLMNVEELSPNYRLTRNYLDHIERYIIEEELKEKERRKVDIVSQTLDYYEHK